MIVTLRAVVFALSLLLIQVGIVRAAHYHSLEIAAQADHHLDCTICLDANQVGAMAAEPTAPLLIRVWSRVPELLAKISHSQALASFYDARGPPTT